MNTLSPQVDAFFRATSALLVGWLIKYGIDEASAAAIAGGLGAVVVYAWGWYVNRPKALVTAAAGTNEVQTITVDTKKFADSIPNDKVTKEVLSYEDQTNPRRG